MKITQFVLLFLILAIAPSFAATTYAISINTGSLAPGSSGFIDFGFNGGYPATAVIDGFSNPGGSLSAATIFRQGTVAGSLPGIVTMVDDNSNYDEGIAFGSSIGFRLTLSGTPSGSIGNVFTLSFFNAGFTGGLLTGNVNDFWLAQFQMDTKGNITPTAFANPAGGASFASIAAVPEAGSGGLLVVGLLGVCVWRARGSCHPTLTAAR